MEGPECVPGSRSRTRAANCPMIILKLSLAVIF